MPPKDKLPPGDIDILTQWVKMGAPWPATGTPIRPRGVITAEGEIEFDVIIFATGFEVGTAYTRRAGFEVYGRNGKTLTSHWGNGMRTLHGMAAHGFPNARTAYEKLTAALGR